MVTDLRDATSALPPCQAAKPMKLFPPLARVDRPSMARGLTMTRVHSPSFHWAWPASPWPCSDWTDEVEKP